MSTSILASTPLSLSSKSKVQFEDELVKTPSELVEISDNGKRQETYVLTSHSRTDFPHDVVLDPALFPGIMVKDFVEIFHPDIPKRKLLLQVQSLDELRGNIQVSVLKSIITNPAFQLKTFQPVVIRKAKRSLYALAYIEMTFKDQYVSQGEFWRLKQKMIGSSCFIGEKVSSCGINLTVDEMLAKKRKPMACGIIEPTTKFIFRSLSARLFWMVQLSKEMWNFAEDGELYFERFVNRFCSDVFSKWNMKGVTHRLTVVFFTRTYFNIKPPVSVSAVYQDYDGRYYSDFYHTVVENDTKTDWNSLRVLLKKSFQHFPKIAGWSLPKTCTEIKKPPERKTQGIEVPFFLHTADSEVSLSADSIAENEECCGMPSTAVEGNCLEAINLCLNIFDKHYMDRDLCRTGQAMVLVTPGQGVFEVDRHLTKLTKQRMMDNAIGCDFVSLSRAPLHVAPIFIYKVTPQGKDVLDQVHPFARKGTYRVGNRGASVESAMADMALDPDQNVLPVYNIPHWIHLSFPFHLRKAEQKVYEHGTDPWSDQDPLALVNTPGSEDSTYAKSTFWKAYMRGACHLGAGEPFEPVPISRMFDLNDPTRSSLPLALMHFNQSMSSRPNSNTSLTPQYFRKSFVSAYKVPSQDYDDNRYHQIPLRTSLTPWYQLVSHVVADNATIPAIVAPGSPMIGPEHIEWKEQSNAWFAHHLPARKRFQDRSSLNRSVSFDRKELERQQASMSPVLSGFSAKRLGVTLASSGHSQVVGSSSVIPSAKSTVFAPQTTTPEASTIMDKPLLEERIMTVVDECKRHDMNVFRRPARQAANQSFKTPKLGGLTSRYSSVASTMHSFMPSSAMMSSSYKSTDSLDLSRKSVGSSDEHEGSYNSASGSFSRTNVLSKTSVPNKEPKSGSEYSIMKFMSEHSVDSNHVGSKSNLKNIIENEESVSTRTLKPSDSKNLFGPGTRISRYGRTSSLERESSYHDLSTSNKSKILEESSSNPSRSTPRIGLMPSMSVPRKFSESSSTMIGASAIGGLGLAAMFVNPFDIEDFLSTKNQRRLTHNRRRWSHLFPTGKFDDEGDRIRLEDFETNSEDSDDSEADMNDEIVPLTIESFRVNWKSIISPGVLPLTTDYYPEPAELDLHYKVNFYSLTLPEKPGDFGYGDYDELIRELVSQRLSQDFQLYMLNQNGDDEVDTKSETKQSPGGATMYNDKDENENDVSSKNGSELAPDDNAASGTSAENISEETPAIESQLTESSIVTANKTWKQTTKFTGSAAWRRSNTITIKPRSTSEKKERPFQRRMAQHNIKRLNTIPAPLVVRTKYLLTMGHEIHELDFTPETREVKIKRLVQNHFSPGSGPGWKYSYLLYDPIENVKSEVTVHFTDVAEFYNWNRLDYMICGYNEDFVTTVKYRRMMFSIMPGNKLELQRQARILSKGSDHVDVTSLSRDELESRDLCDTIDEWNPECLSAEEEKVYIGRFEKFVSWLQSKVNESTPIEVEMYGGEHESQEHRIIDSTRLAKVEIQSRNAGRYEWLLVQYDSAYIPSRSFHLEVQWMVAAGSSIQNFILAMTRRAKQAGLNLQQMPEYCRSTAKNFKGRVPHPFVLPKKIYFDLSQDRMQQFYETLIDGLRSRLQYELDTVSTKTWPILVHRYSYAFLHLSDTSIEYIPNKLVTQSNILGEVITPVELFGKTRDICETVSICVSIVFDLVDEIST